VVAPVHHLHGGVRNRARPHRVAVLWRPKERRRHSPLGNGFIVLSGVVAPAIILFIILLVAMKSQVALSTPETELTVRIIGHQWWWEVRYPEQQIVTANEMHIPAGEPVRMELSPRM
jgi:cytochrome c oxidase subunit II